MPDKIRYGSFIATEITPTVARKTYGCPDCKGCIWLKYDGAGCEDMPECRPEHRKDGKSLIWG